MSVPEVKSLSVGTMDNNVYILTCPVTGKRVLIDPANEPDVILDTLDTPGLEYILLTHGDWDHFLALDEVRQATGAPVGMHPADLHILDGRSSDFQLHDRAAIRSSEAQL